MDILNQHPELLAYIAVVDGKLVFEFDERKAPLEQMMLALHTITSEYMKALAEQAMPPQNNYINKDTTHAKKKRK